MELSDSEEENKLPYIIRNNKFGQEAASEEDEEELDKTKHPLHQLMPPSCAGYLEMLPDRSKATRDPEPTRVIPPDECFGPCPKIVRREEWGARLPKVEAGQMMFRVRASVFKESECNNCSDVISCVRNVQLLQTYQMDYLGFTDIAYSFMIGEDGNIYEGRGWGRECEKACGFMGIGFLGYYTDEGKTRPSDEMLQLAYDLIMCGVRMGFLANPFTLWGHGQTPVEMMRDYIESEEDIDYKTKIEDPGIY